MKKNLSKMLVLLFVAMSLFTACSKGEDSTKDDTATNEATDVKKVGEGEVYTWACQYNSLPLFVNNDYIGMDLIAEQLGVEVRKIGPQEVDLPAFIAAIEQEIAQKPDGMMVVGWDASLATAIDKAVAAGIPVVTVDADVPDSDRLCFIGTDWYQLGVEQAKAVAPYLEGKTGNAICIGVPGGDNNQQALRGYTDTMTKLNPNITVEQKVYDSGSNAQTVASVVANLIQSDASLLAVAGFDSSAGPGIALAIKEAGKIGAIFGTCVDAEAEHLQGVKEGSLVAAVGQKRHFFTYYGVRMLFDYNHNNIKFTKDDVGAGISNIPTYISTGFIVATPSNVDLLIEAAAEKAK